MGLDGGPEGHKTDGGRMKEEDSDAPLNTSMVFTIASSSLTNGEYGFGKSSTAGFKMDVNHGIAGLEMDVAVDPTAGNCHEIRRVRDRRLLWAQVTPSVRIEIKAGSASFMNQA